jgi:hypothetical protein
MRFKPAVTLLIAAIVAVLAAISLNNQAMLETDEIGDVSVLEINLIPPFRAAKTFCAQHRPQPRFCFGRFPTHGFFAFGH